MRKCKGMEKVAVMEVEAAAKEEEEVGVRMTRARSRATAAATASKRKLSGGELSFSSSLVQLKHRRRIAFVTENSTSPAASENSNDPRFSPSSDHALASCCSSNASSELARQNFRITDLEEEEASSLEIATSTTYSIESRERRETTSWKEFEAESAELEATTARPSEANSRRRLMAVKMPSDAELEDFFSTAEKDLQKQFAEKYNFDIVKEEALEGRYEWIQVKP